LVEFTYFKANREAIFQSLTSVHVEVVEERPFCGWGVPKKARTELALKIKFGTIRV
jgi:hypothetical protein